MKQKNLPKAVLFDLDGTLADTISDITHAMNAVMNELHLSPITETDCKRYVGKGLRNALTLALNEKHLYPDETEIKEYLHLLMDTYRKHPFDKSQAYPGIDQFLEKLVAAGIQLGVLSNKDEQLVVMIVDALFGHVPFVSVAGATCRYPSKPDPTLAQRFAQEAGLHVRDVLLIGDSEIDYHTAQAAGMQVALLTWGFRNRTELASSGCFPLYDTVREIETEVFLWR
jgi:phosphoglycolate phosphatase